MAYPRIEGTIALSYTIAALLPFMSSTPSTPTPETTLEITLSPAPETVSESVPVPVPMTMTPEACAAQLKQLFPALFTGGPKPLKLRIQADIQERAPGQFTKAALSAFLRRYTGGTGYLIAVSKATHRFDLDGAPAAELSDEHRQVALDELARRRERQNEKRAEQEQAQRQRASLLRDFERTTLTPANFCALKGVPLEELDGLLALARQEAAAPPAQHRPRDDRRDGRPAHRAERPPRGDRAPRDAKPRSEQG